MSKQISTYSLLSLCLHLAFYISQDGQNNCIDFGFSALWRASWARSLNLRSLSDCNWKWLNELCVLLYVTVENSCWHISNKELWFTHCTSPGVWLQEMLSVQPISSVWEWLKGFIYLKGIVHPKMYWDTSQQHLVGRKSCSLSSRLKHEGRLPFSQ